MLNSFCRIAIEHLSTEIAGAMTSKDYTSHFEELRKTLNEHHSNLLYTVPDTMHQGLLFYVNILSSVSLCDWKLIPARSLGPWWTSYRDDGHNCSAGSGGFGCGVCDLQKAKEQFAKKVFMREEGGAAVYVKVETGRSPSSHKLMLGNEDMVD